MEGLAKNAEVSYIVGDEDEMEEPDEALVKKAMSKIFQTKDKTESEEKDNEVPEEKPKGLMMRRGAM